MTIGSLKIRLLLVSALTIFVSLLLAMLALNVIFRQHVETRVYDELENHLWQLVDAIEFDDKDKMSVSRSLADSRFDRPLSGLYWQISEAGKAVATSSSLWDQTLPAPAVADSTPAKWLTLIGPESVPLVTIARTIKIKSASAPHELQLLVAVNRSEVDKAVADFSRDLLMSLGVIAALLGVGAFVQAQLGLRPLKTLAAELKQLRSGASKRLVALGPDEVRPLVDEVNALLADQEASIARARARAGDLAHGLKTPLTVLNSVARQIDAGAINGAAADIREQTGLMDRHVQRQLAMTRLAPERRHAATPVRPVVDRIASSMRRLPSGEHITWNVGVPASAMLAVDPEDLTELLGNLADNASKWAHGAVTIGFEQRGDTGVLSVEDDGPGVPEAQRQSVIERGIRLDPSRPGSGLGLSIVADICKAYGWQLSLQQAASGGLSARIEAAARQSGR